MKFKGIASLFLFLVFFFGIGFSAHAQGVDFNQGLNGENNQTDNGDIFNSPNTPLQTVKTYQKSTPAITNGAKDLSAVDPDRYFIQAGDSLRVEMWTPVHSIVEGVVSPMGTLNLNPIGDVPVQGVALKDLSAYLEKELKNYFKDVRVTADLTDVRLVKVQVLGEVKRPGEYELSGVTGALDAVEKAGGLTANGSLRRIEIQKQNHAQNSLDYFRWRVLGDVSQNPYLEPNEVIYVPVLKNVVSINGEVHRPGTYEVLTGETFGKLLEMAGEYTPEAVPNEAKLSRIISERTRESLPIKENVALINGDSIQVPTRGLFEEKIKIEGELVGTGVFESTKNTVTGETQIERSGWYSLHKGEHVRDVVMDMGGFTPQADPSRAWVERRNSNGEKQIIPLNLNKLFAENDQSQNISLLDGDTLVVPPSPNSIFVVGAVLKAGIFKYTPGNDVSDYVALAGGGDPHAVLSHVKVVRTERGSSRPDVYDVNLKAMLTGQRTAPSPLLEPGDVIYVPRTSIAGIQDILGFLGNIFLLKALFP